MWPAATTPLSGPAIDDVLLGVDEDDVVAVTADASPAGRKTFALWQPPELPGAAAPWSSTALELDPWASDAVDPEPTGSRSAAGGSGPTPGGLIEDDPDRPRRSATAEIAELLKLWQNKQRASADVKRIAQAHVADLERRIAEMQAMRQTLAELAHCCAGDSRPDCPILSGLAD